MRVFEDFALGMRIELGPLAVERDDVIAFAGEFDPQAFHLDDAAADASLLGGMAASGWHSCALMMRMMCDAFLLDAASEGSPGVEEVRWLLPVRPGDVLSGVATVVDARRSRSRPDLGILKMRNEMTNQAGETVLVCDYAVMLGTRRAA